MGPFETWDALGVTRVREDIRAADHVLPDWVDDVPEGGFYADEGSREWIPAAGAFRPDPKPADEWGASLIKRDDRKTLWKSEDAALLDAGDGVALFEFRTKANTLGQELLEGLAGAIERVETDRDLRGMIIGNEGSNFSVGANLAEMAMAVMMGQIDQIGPVIERFQRTVLKIRYASKPVVLAVHQRVLGGACEMSIACPHPVAAAESYIGLIELGVGLIPAGGGSMLMAAKASESAADADRPSEVQPFLRKYFEQIAMAKVATSAVMAQEMGYLSPQAVIVMNGERRFDVARREVLRLSDEGYRPPPARTAIRVQGATGRAQFEAALHQFRGGAYISEYDAYLAQRLAWVMTGGELTGPADVHEDYLLELEREVFLSLLGEEKTRARIESILTTNKPLRN
jgi:3-hydroxyacyl-CoA dehydrogenase